MWGSKIKVILSSALVLALNSFVHSSELDLNKSIFKFKNNTFYYSLGFDTNAINQKKDYFKTQKYQTQQGTPLRFSDVFEDIEYQPVKATVVTYFDIDHIDSVKDKVLALYVKIICEVAEVQINGHILDSSLNFNSEAEIIDQKRRRNQILSFPGSILKEKDNQLIYFIAGDSRIVTTGLYYEDNLEIAGLEYLTETHNETLDLILISLYLFVGLYHILLWSKRRQDRYNLLFGIYSIGLFIYLLLRTTYGLLIFTDTRWTMKVEYSVLFFLVPLFYSFLQTLFFKKIDRIVKLLFFIAAGFAAPVFFVPHYISNHILFYWQVSALVMVSYSGYIFYKALKLKRPEAKSLLVGFILVIAAAIYDIVDSMILTYGLAFMKYAFFAFVMGIAVLLARRFLKVHNQVEELNANLELKVEERTQELQQTLEKVQALKTQQDGDYFLTSLLIKPLGKVIKAKDPVVVEGLAIQKKKFKFRDRKGEIGGDINIANNIKLSNKDYIAFMNGDAMGKSIQGAGGALIMGVMLNSFITRTRLSRQFQERSPEQWIRDCYYDLQSVFETFDGSMLASMVVGLIDVQLGSVYFFNAEHPWTVLYRDKKAEFIEDELYLRKVGVGIKDKTFNVRTFQLHHNDSLILGSDGRDDIILGISSDGERIINEDENLFLEHIEKGQGDLQKIRELIKEKGELSDDFTLLKITYNGQSSSEQFAIDALSQNLQQFLQQGIAEFKNKNFQQALSEFEKVNYADSLHPEALKYAIKCALKLKNYKKVADYGSKVLEFYPLMNEFLFLASYAGKKVKAYSKAADYGERLRLREPANIDNLINLADVYRKMKNLKRVKQLIEQAESINENDTRLKKLKDFIATA